MAQHTEYRPGTKQLRFALVGLPVSVLFLGVLLGVGAEAEMNDVGYWVVQVLAWVGMLLLLASVTALFVGIWKRLA